MVYQITLLIFSLKVKLVTKLIKNGNKPFNCNTESFTKLFFLYTIEGWYSVDPTIINWKSLGVFKNNLLGFIRPVQQSIYSVFNPQVLTFLIRLRLRLSHWNKRRFRQNFKDCIKLSCSCSFEVENMLHFFSAPPTLFRFSHGSYE